jgi:hypothetical protein
MRRRDLAFGRQLSERPAEGGGEDTFKAYGSLRVAYVLYEALALAKAGLALPLRPFDPATKKHVLSIAEPFLA